MAIDDGPVPSVPPAPVAAAITRVFRTFLREDSVMAGAEGTVSEVRVCSYARDFELLWGIGKHGAAGVLEGQYLPAQLLVVVDDGIPPKAETGVITVAPHVTALEWAACLGIRDPEGGFADPTQVVVVDAYGHQATAGQPGALAEVVRALVPHLQVPEGGHAQRVRGAASGASGRGAESVITTLLDALGTTGTSAAARRYDPAVAAALRRIMVEDMLGTAGRHAVSNIIAPLEMAQGLDALAWPGSAAVGVTIRSDRPRDALAKKLQILGLSKGTTSAGAAVPERTERPQRRDFAVPVLADAAVRHDLFGQFAPGVRFLLVDDQARHGFHDILACILFGDDSEEGAGLLVTRSRNGTSSLTSSEDPRPLLSSLYRAVGREPTGAVRTQAPVGRCARCGGRGTGRPVPWGQPRVLGAPAGADGSASAGAVDAGFDVLILDLRLFGSEETPSAAEAGFLQDLLDFYHQAGLCAGAPSAVGLDYQALVAAAASARCRLESAQHPRAGGDARLELAHLLLLPLLLVATDPSLPILLFSTTQQRALVEVLSRHPSVLTGSAKPALTGYTEPSIPGESIARLATVLRQALLMHESRCVWRRLTKTNWGKPPVVEAAGRRLERKDRLAVFNADPSVALSPWRGLERYHDHRTLQPRLDGEALRARLVVWYVRYLMCSGWYDFVSLPWELLEEALVPKDLLELPWIKNAYFDLPERLDARNHIAQAIQGLRNKKTHGMAAPPRTPTEEQRDFREAALLEALMLLDFIAGETSAAPKELDAELLTFELHLKAKYRHLSGFRGRIEPYNLMVDHTVRWRDFAALTAAWRAIKSTEGETTHLSASTVDTILRLLAALSGDRSGAGGTVT